MTKLVVIESPFAGGIWRNVQYARAALLDSLGRGEYPIASHLLYPQVLNDATPALRELGIEAGLAWALHADLTAVYADLGMSPGMRVGISRAESEGRPIEWRSLRDPLHQ